MAVKYLKAITPASRGRAVLDLSALTTDKPEKTLTSGKKSISGRDNHGRISVRRRGSGNKRKYRRIDFKRNKHDIEAVVKSIEYDPNRTAFIALIVYKDGEKRYILAPEGLKTGDKIISGEDVKSVTGNALPLGNINTGSFIHNVELQPRKGGQIIRSAGSYGKLLGCDGKYASVQMPSGEVRMILRSCYATVGAVSNRDHINTQGGKAGWSRWKGRRPKVRGVVMNPVDHPMGGGEGRSSGGRHPCSPTGKLRKGYKTRKVKKYSDKFIIRKRKKKR